jgi:hypothetical protein
MNAFVRVAPCLSQKTGLAGNSNNDLVRQMEFNVKNGNFCNINEIYFKKLGKINRCYGKKAPGQSYGENIEIK